MLNLSADEIRPEGLTDRSTRSDGVSSGKLYKSHDLYRKHQLYYGGRSAGGIFPEAIAIEIRPGG